MAREVFLDRGEGRTGVAPKAGLATADRSSCAAASTWEPASCMLVARRDAIRLSPAASVGGVHDFGPSVRQYRSAFEEAGLGRVGRPPDAVARRIRHQYKQRL